MPKMIPRILSRARKAAAPPPSNVVRRTIQPAPVMPAPPRPTGMMKNAVGKKLSSMVKTNRAPMPVVPGTTRRTMKPPINRYR